MARIRTAARLTAYPLPSGIRDHQKPPQGRTPPTRPSVFPTLLDHWLTFRSTHGKARQTQGS